ncbi:protein of unknown function [Bryocella elongata]|uniref:TMEM205-like domain-containing protein n=1 Tax=Bryocella elongata TaxID=863522 RepID=A0A1H5SM62_9BACT|nr:DUF4149 domain-containing protein [Bryocella elongata]SEF51679.1 protein of unknown function [Bryocella elongata]
MLTVLRILRTYALAAWVGGLAFFIVVAAIAFSTLPTPFLAGQIVRGSLIAIHRIGLGAGLIYLLATLVMLATRRDGHPTRVAEVVLAAVMLTLTMYSQMSIIPRMDTDRNALGGDVTKSSPGVPAYDDFQKLHVRSTRVEGAVLILGLIVLALGPIHGRNEYIPPIL